MASTTLQAAVEAPPDHLQLPETDGSITVNTQEHPQSNLLTDCLQPRLRELHPDGQYLVCCDVGIYWRYTEPVLDGCKGPDWFYVPGIPPMLGGTYRRSYVLWMEAVRPLIVIEYVSGDGSEEHDATPYKGKFWVYEQAICAPFYAIFDSRQDSLELHALNEGRYHAVEANAAGRFPVPPLGIELGLWHGTYRNMTLPWLRVWDAQTGKLLPVAEERADAAEGLIDDMQRMLSEETERAEAERKRAEVAEKELLKLREKLRAAGVDPEG